MNRQSLQALRTAAQHFSPDRLTDAETICRRLLGDHPQATDVLHLLALVRKQLGHPFKSRNKGVARLTGCWSVLLQRGGYHVNHVHPEGWISSAYYVEVPPEVEDVET